MNCIVKYFFLTLICVLALPAQAASLRNQLKGHPSAYLALHGSDPVAWQKWQPSVMRRARRENKLVYLSIGYFSCHWCHVMQRESYKNARIAAFINKHFIPVKIDRELEAALDNRMIAFAEATLGAAGWPLNVFITPEGYPLYAMLYRKPGDFLKEVTRLQQLWQANANDLKKLAQRGSPRASGPGKPVLKIDVVKQHVRAMIAASLAIEDPISGGFGGQGKFPSVPQLEFLLQYQTHFPNNKIRKLLLNNLDAMMNNGLHDQLGGGFFRYTVDPHWQTPHFEKMLYDNVLLARLYLRAGRVLSRPDYTSVGQRTLKFLIQHMRLPTGGMMASFSAIDNKAVEGGYYLWSRQQLKDILSKREYRVYTRAAAIKDAAPFDAGYLPLLGENAAIIAKKTGLPLQTVRALLSTAQTKLMQQRSKRILPKDRKVLAGWNGLALSAYAEAARTENNAQYRKTAAGIRHYILTRLWNGRRLIRAQSKGKPFGSSGLQDYVYVARGLYDWALLSGNKKDLLMVQRIVDVAWQRFYSNKGWRQKDQSLIRAEPGSDAILDGPLPSPSAELIDLSLSLGHRLDDKKLRTRALAALNSGHDSLRKNPFWYAGHIKAMLNAWVMHRK